jgi:hypothetical protein
VMMIPAGGKERSLASVALRDFKPEHVMIKFQRPIQIRDFQMNVTDFDFGMDRFGILSHDF